MRYGSLFSGVGGFDLGLDRAGMSCAWQVEKDPMARGVLDYHWNYPTFDDVTTFGKASAPDGSVDLICGGFPCQDLSVAGRRAGLAGERSGLFYEFMRLAAEFAPRWLLIENVPGLLSSDEGRDMAIVTSTLAGLGYGWAYRILDSQYFGLAQRRRRVFIVCCLGEPARAAKVLFESDCLRGDSQPGGETGQGDKDRVAACLNSGGNHGGFRTEPGEHIVAQPLRAGRQFSDMGDGQSNVVVGTLHSGHPSRDAGDASNNHLVVGALTSRHAHNDDVAGAAHHLVVGTLSAHSSRHGHAMTTQQAAEAGHLIACPDPAYAVNGNGSKFGSGRDNQDTFVIQQNGSDVQVNDKPGTLTSGMARGTSGPVVFCPTQITSPGNYSNPQPGDPCHPLTAGAQPPTIAYNWQSGGDVRLSFNGESSPALSVGQVPAVGVRRLTPRETERLQGFPDDHSRWRIQNGEIVEQSDSARYRQMGNAVSVPVAQWIARRIVEANS